MVARRRQSPTSELKSRRGNKKRSVAAKNGQLDAKTITAVLKNQKAIMKQYEQLRAVQKLVSKKTGGTTKRTTRYFTTAATPALRKRQQQQKKKKAAKKKPVKQANATELDAQLDAYMGDDVRKSRLDTELDAYFASNEDKSRMTGEAGEIVQ